MRNRFLRARFKQRRKKIDKILITQKNPVIMLNFACLQSSKEQF